MAQMTKKQVRTEQDKLAKIRRVVWITAMAGGIASIKAKSPKLQIAGIAIYTIGAAGYYGLFGADLAYNRLIDSISD